MKRICMLLLCLSLVLGLPAGAEENTFEPYPAYCNKPFVIPLISHPDGDFANALVEHQVVMVLKDEGDRLEVLGHTVSGEGKRAWLAKGDVTAVEVGDWHKLMVIDNPNPADRLNLRKQAKTNTISLGKYYNGVMPIVLGPSKRGWTQVAIEGRKGYMRTEFLREGLPLQEDSAISMLSVEPKSGKRVSLKLSPWKESSNLGLYSGGDQVKLLGVASDWCHVEGRNGMTGFMPLSVFQGQID